MTIFDFTIFINYCSSISICLPVLVAVIFSKTFNLSLKVLFFYVLICGIVEFVSFILFYDSINNLWLFHIQSLIEFACLMYIFFLLLKIEHKQKLLSIIIFSFFIICLLDIMFVSGHLKVNELARNIEGFTFIVMAILYFKSLMSQKEHQNLLQQFSFWFSSAVLIYFSGSLFIFLFSNYLLDNSPETLFGIYAIHSILNIIFNILLAICFTKKSIDA